MALFPIWNVADMAIVVGVVGILVFQKKFHKILAEAAEAKEAQAAEAKAAEGAPAAPEPEGATATPDLSVNGMAPPGTAETLPAWTPPAIGEDEPPE